MDKDKLVSDQVSYTETPEEKAIKDKVIKDFISAKGVVQKSYNQFNGRTLYECIDDWTKRWNGYIPPMNPLVDADSSRVFLNITRNIIIAYLSKVALSVPKIKVVAVNKKSHIPFQKLAESLNDLNTYSLNAEDGEQRFFESCLEVTVKGTVIKYEGYAQRKVKRETPKEFNAETGEIETEKLEVVEYDDCFQEIVPVEDFFIPNPYQPEIQKQPFVIWRKITTKEEAEIDFGHYKKWGYVTPGKYIMSPDVSTFYRNQMMTELKPEQVEIVRYYHKSKNKHVVMINGVVLYDGPIPFKDGRYPFAKGIFEPFGNDFFWGAGFPQKIMGDQDLVNTLWNMMIDKTETSLTPLSMSSDLDDLIEDEYMTPGKVRKVNDVNAWRFEQLPGVTSGEQGVMQSAMSFIRENAGTYGGGEAYSPRGGKLQTRQIMLKQQEALQKVGFSMNFMETFEKDRTQLRISHIMQFYSIPKIDKITGDGSKEITKLTYRDVKLENQTLSDGRKGNKVIKLVGDEVNDENKRAKLADELSVTEMMGEEKGIPTEAVAVSVDSFRDYDYSVMVVKNSSYEKNQVLDQATRHEYANWRMSLAQAAPVDVPALIAWVDESHDLPSDKFVPKQVNPQEQATNAAAGQSVGKAASGNQGMQNIMNDNSGSKAMGQG